MPDESRHPACSRARLLFLHADTRLPASALDRIESTLLNDRVVGGGFARRYDSNSWFLRTTCLLAGLRTRMIGWFLGDQAIFVRRGTFEKLGGFRDLELFEDLDFSMRMRQTGRVGHAISTCDFVVATVHGPWTGTYDAIRRLAD